MVLKELIFNIFYFGRVWWSMKELIFNILYFGSGVMVIFNSLYLLVWN